MRCERGLNGVGLDVRVSPRLPLIQADGDRLERAIANFVRNAVEHTPAGGRIFVSVQPDGTDVTVMIEDTGDGIDAQDLPQVWTRFYRPIRPGHGRMHRTERCASRPVWVRLPPSAPC